MGSDCHCFCAVACPEGLTGPVHLVVEENGELNWEQFDGFTGPQGPQGLKGQMASKEFKGRLVLTELMGLTVAPGRLALKVTPVPLDQPVARPGLREFRECREFLVPMVLMGLLDRKGLRVSKVWLARPAPKGFKECRVSRVFRDQPVPRV